MIAVLNRQVSTPTLCLGGLLSLLGGTGALGLEHLSLYDELHRSLLRDTEVVVRLGWLVSGTV